MLKKAEAEEALAFVKACRELGASAVAITADGGVTVHFAPPGVRVGNVTQPAPAQPHPEQKPKRKKDEPPADPRMARQNIRNQVVEAAKNGGFRNG